MSTVEDASADQDKSPASSSSADNFSTLSKSTSPASQTTTSPLSAPSPQATHTPPANHAMDDVFGSPSPSRSPSPSQSQTHSGSHLNSNTHGESSNFPHLRRTNYTLGYRAGISDGKNAPETAQRGFDEGFPVGAELGVRAGWILGMLEELVRHSGSKAGGDAQDMLTKAEEAVGLEGIMRNMESLDLLTAGVELDDKKDWRIKDGWLREIGVVHEWVQKVQVLAQSKGVETEVDWGG